VRATESLPEPSGMHVNDALVDVNAYVTKQEAGKEEAKKTTSA
jgi:hypothetical protein